MNSSRLNFYSEGNSFYNEDSMQSSELFVDNNLRKMLRKVRERTLIMQGGWDLATSDNHLDNLQSLYLDEPTSDMSDIFTEKTVSCPKYKF
ncbi:MAG: hypothetical protein QXW79_01050 [Thermoplasmata archaeon]